MDKKCSRIEGRPRPDMGEVRTAFPDPRQNPADPGSKLLPPRTVEDQTIAALGREDAFCQKLRIAAPRRNAPCQKPQHGCRY